MLEMLNEELKLSMVLTHCMEVADITEKQVVHMLKIDNVFARLWIILLINFLKAYIPFGSVLLRETFTYCSEFAIDFSGWTSKNKVADCISSKLDIAKTSKDVNFLISNDYSCSCCVLYRKLSLPLLSTNSSDAPTQMISLKCFNIFYFKSLQVKVV